MLKLDMINLNLRLPRLMIDDHLGEHYIDTESYIQRVFFNDPNNTIYDRFKISDYRHNIVIPCDQSSIYLGIMHNSKNHLESQNIDIKIEYNPAKVFNIPDSIKHLIFASRSCKIKSIDVAYDLDIDIDRITFLEGRKNINIYKGTFYVGARSCEMKIYDKAKEQGIKDRNITRVEYRLPLDMDISSCDCNLERFIYPDVLYLTDLEDNKNIAGKYKCMIAGVAFMPTNFQCLSYQERKTLKKATESLDRLKFSDLYKDIRSLIHTIQLFYHKIGFDSTNMVQYDGGETFTFFDN